MKPKTHVLLLSILFIIVGIIIGVIASKYLPVLRPLTPEAVCHKGGYQDVRSCGGYFIAGKPCCDQGADIWNEKNQIVVRCGGWGSPPSTPESECEKLLKNLDTKNCQELACSPEDAKKIRPPYSLWEQPLLFIRQLLSENFASRAISTAVKVIPTPPSTNPTANWKTYTHSEISFMFPPDWINEPIQTYGSRSVVEFRYQTIPLFELTVTGNYNQISSKPYITLDEYIGPRINKAKNITVNGIPAKIITGPGDPGHVIPYQEVVLFSPDKSNIISLYYKDSEYDSQNRTLNKILSTFKFLDQKDTIPNINPTIDIPTPNSKITSPVKISGHIPRDWTFEANFIIEIQNQNHIPLSSTPVNVTFLKETDPIGSFSASINYFAEPETKNGYLIIKSDNASGLPEKNKSFEVPVTF